MKGFRTIFFLFVFLCIDISFYAQNKAIKLNIKLFEDSDKIELNNAEDLYVEGYYLLAIPIYEQLCLKYPLEYYVKYRLGMCYLKKQDSYVKAVEYLKPVAEKYPNSADVKFYLGIAYHLTYKFDEAFKEFNEYLVQDIAKSQRPITERLLQNCYNAKLLLKNPVKVTITNIGAPINTEASEYVPVISSDEKTMVFTYMGKRSKGGYEDVFIAEKNQSGDWGEPQPLGDNINSYEHDASIALSPDGQTLFIYKDTKNRKGDIYYSKLDGNEWSAPKVILGDVNTVHWEGSASLSADGKTLYFTSDKPGGFGGRDIYKAKQINDSIWGNVENLGPIINTPYNDDAPFIHPDGRTLIFSSEGHNSMGSYDIFHSELQRDGTWKNPINIGYPINSPDRDTYYVLSADGQTGYFSSGRPGGVGLQDIYSVAPGLVGYKPVLALVKGTITLNNKPVEADIEVINKKMGTSYSKFSSNALSGEYLSNLPTGVVYEIFYKLKNCDYSLLSGDSVILELINIEDTDTFIEIHKNISFKSIEFIANAPEVNEVVVAEENGMPEEEIYKIETIEPVKDKIIIKPIEDKIVEIKSDEIGNSVTGTTPIGEQVVENLIFKVQIAAFNLPKNYNYSKLIGLGAVEKNILDDGITRFTIGGSFNSLNEATYLKTKVVASGQVDAFVTAIYNGKRIYLEELLDLGILHE